MQQGLACRLPVAGWRIRLEVWRGGLQLVAFGVYGSDLRGDLLEALVGLAFQKGQGHAIGSVQCRRTVLHQGSARIQEFLHRINGFFLGRGQVWL